MTQHVRSCTQAAYAESNDQQIDSKVEAAVQVMKSPLSRFFRIENDQGAYVGYFIMMTGQLVQHYIRPHFALPQGDLDRLFKEAMDPRYFASIGSDNLVNVNLL